MCFSIQVLNKNVTDNLGITLEKFGQTKLILVHNVKRTYNSKSFIGFVPLFYISVCPNTLIKIIIAYFVFFLYISEFT